MNKTVEALQAIHAVCNDNHPLTLSLESMASVIGGKGALAYGQGTTVRYRDQDGRYGIGQHVGPPTNAPFARVRDADGYYHMREVVDVM